MQNPKMRSADRTAAARGVIVGFGISCGLWAGLLGCLAAELSTDDDDPAPVLTASTLDLKAAR